MVLKIAILKCAEVQLSVMNLYKNLIECCENKN